MSLPPATPPRLLPVFTFAVWTSCAVVGGLGLFLAYPRPVPPPKEAEPVRLPLAMVELPKEPPPKNETTPEVKTEIAVPNPEEAPAPEARPEPRAPSPPAAPPPFAPPHAPAFTPVAPPDAAIAFAVPVEGPVRVVPRDLAAAGRTTGSPTGVPGGTGPKGGVPGGVGKTQGSPGGGSAAPQAQNLVFGHGEGVQAKPDYPREAQRRRQEGTVRIRLAVDESGAVTQAEVEEACPFPLLNQAALATVKHHWNFPVGKKRLYTVAIKFILQ